MMSMLQMLRLPLFLIGLVLFFATERYFSVESFHLALRIASLVLIAVGAVAPLVIAARQAKAGLTEEAKSWRYLFAWQAAVALSPLLYLVYRQVLGGEPKPDSLLEKGLLALWLLLAVLGGSAGIGLETAHRGSGRGPLAEPRRIRMTGSAWLLVGMLASFLVCLNYFGVAKDRTYDWSYLKTTKPGESSEKMVKTLDKDLEVAIFYSHDNEVRPFVAEYFDALARLDPNVKVTYYDKELHPTEAETFRVSRNGQVVLKYDEKRERIDIGDTLARARTVLRKLDGEFQKTFLALTSKRNVAYFTRGHGEMEWTSSEQNPLRSVQNLELLLRSQNYSLRTFGSAQGAFDKVPDDASMVVILGPTKPFLKEEVAVIQDFVEKGGRLYVLLDVEDARGADDVFVAQGPDPLKEYLATIGLAYVETRLANDRQYVSATRSQVDRWFIYSNVFTSHESVLSLSRHADQTQVIMFQSGYFDLPQAPKGWRVFETIKSLNSTFDDKDKNFAFTEGENRKTYVLGAAAHYSPEPAKSEDGQAKAKPVDGKVLVFADASAVSDALLRNPGNQLLLVDSFKWLAGQTDISGAITTEEDVKIQHSRARELFAFHGSIFAVPVLVLIAGFFSTRKRKARKVTKDA